jgi:hypothetical protein
MAQSGRVPSVVPFPEDEYINLIGRVVYAVGYLEWSILGDLSRISGLPSGLDVASLAGLTTGSISARLLNPSLLAQIADARVSVWLRSGGEHLRDAATRRNSLLHARPATIGGKQRLYRWEPGRREAFPIDEKLLRDLLADIDAWVRDLSSKRLPMDGRGAGRPSC